MFKYFGYIGLYNESYESRKEKYEPVNEDVAQSFLEYVTDLDKKQSQRLETIETKTSQLIGQSSVVLSLIGLFIPLFFDKLNDLPAIWKIILILGFTITVFHFVLSIWQALKMFEVDKTRFMNGATSTITKKTRHLKKNGFINEQINDYIRIVNHNNSATNKIAGNLVYASRCFKIGIISLSFFIIIIISASFFIKDKAQQVLIVNKTKEDQSIDSLIKKMQELITVSKPLQTNADTTVHKSDTVK